MPSTKDFFWPPIEEWSKERHFCAGIMLGAGIMAFLIKLIYG